MKSGYMQMREDQLSRKLALMLGSQHDWLEMYSAWCADNDVSDTEAHEQRNIDMFVKQQRRAA